MNPSLRAAIDNARAENMPFDNIDRAVKKGSGEGKDGAQIEEVIYEAYGPGGTAIMIETLTDNRNRTIADLKNVMTKKGGNIGASGSVSYFFRKKGLIEISAGQKSAEEIELAVIDAGAEDIKTNDEQMEVYTDPQMLMQVKNAIEKNGINVESASLTYVSQTEAAIKEAEIAKKLFDLIDAIEDLEDVTTVYSNENVDDEVMQAMAD